ncbi:MAG: hypothetical protein A3E83_03615 [Gammaproteobacteria bacterium RIFCSPHIGHO2_12_FULL_41_20]|nr:MAG: hypothetical protein A3E83_03615 [Gammaproteobacteria bacterium RIFCSPHIGHO2_12_FULL_41_20]
MTTNFSFLFQANENILPHQALAAFFHGPTFADCGSVLQACVYRAIEEMLGSDTFNRLFGNALSRFVITPILYREIPVQMEYPDVSQKNRLHGGNPLYFLFDSIDTPTEKDIVPGDILYIKGIEKYPYKHPAGTENGENVICIGRNPAGENLYLGFGPVTFPQPLTYAEIRVKLIHAYNLPQSTDSKEKIHLLQLSTATDAIEKLTHKPSASIATLLANDHVDDHQPIGGITHAIRFNPQKLLAFLQRPATAWHTLPLAELERGVSATATQAVHQVTSFPAESRGKSFANYAVTQPVQAQMLTVAQQFAAALCNNKQEARGLILTGMPGIGKTHLSIAVATYAAQHGRRVLFIDAETIGNAYQKIGEQRGVPPSDAEMEQLFAEWLDNIDLVILDDINTQYGTSARFLILAIQYVITRNKALMVSSNQPVNTLQTSLPDYIGYTDPRSANFLVIRDLQGPSYRSAWWQHPIPHPTLTALTTNDDALALLAHTASQQAAGIVIESQEQNLEQLCQRYLALSPQKNVKIRIVQEPYRGNYIYDFYIHDASEYDVFIIKVNDNDECEQLLKLVSQIHNLGKKLIVVTDNKTQLQQNLARWLSYNRETQPRLTDRLHNLLLQQADWGQVRLMADNMTPATSSMGMFAASIQRGPKAAPTKPKRPPRKRKKHTLTYNTAYSSITIGVPAEDGELVLSLPRHLSPS